MISNPLAYFDVSIEDSHVGRVVVEFFSDVAPQVFQAIGRFKLWVFRLSILITMLMPLRFLPIPSF